MGILFENMDENENNSDVNVLQTSINRFQKIIRKPENFLSIQEKKAENIKSLVKSLYDYGKIRDETIEAKSLPTLCLDGMDEEQIWQQLELKNNACWNTNLTNTSKLLSYQENKLTLNYHFANETDSEDDEDTEDESNFVNKIDENEELESIDEEEEEDEEMDDDDEENPNKNRITVIKGDPTKSSIVDDQFFKLDELRQFLDAEDRKEVKKQNGVIIEDDEDEQINYFDDVDDELSDEEDAEQNVKYSDFFGNDGETIIEKKMKYKSDLIEKRKKMRNEDLGIDDSEIDEDKAEVSTSVRFDLSKNKYKSDSEMDDEDDNDDDVDEDDTKPHKKLVDVDDNLIPKSNFQLRQERLKNSIETMEEKALDKKSWQLRGEINATSRPQNSLLEEVLEFDSSVRPVPIITEETTIRLEDIIKQRIKDKAFDDVERKIKPIDTPHEYRKRLILDQEKSKESLVTIYEKEYFKQMDALNPNNEDNVEKEPKEHTEIRRLVTALFSKLDALSNYHYTPKPTAPEIKIINNTPAIDMEEVAPVAVSSAALLAPEEVKQRPKGDILGRNERNKTDKKRERRQKKIKQKNIKKREEERNLARAAKGIPLRKKAEEKQILEKVVKSRNVDKMAITGTSKDFTSSTAFFSKLQDKSAPGFKGDKLKEKKSKKGLKTAAQFKL